MKGFVRWLRRVALCTLIWSAYSTRAVQPAGAALQRPKIHTVVPGPLPGQGFPPQFSAPCSRELNAREHFSYTRRVSFRRLCTEIALRESLRKQQLGPAGPARLCPAPPIHAPPRSATPHHAPPRHVPADASQRGCEGELVLVQ